MDLRSSHLNDRYIQLSFVAITLSLLAMVFVSIWWNRRDSASDKTLKANSFEIVDEDGTVRVHMGVAARGQTELSLSDPSGKPRARFLIGSQESSFEVSGNAGQSFSVVYSDRPEATVTLRGVKPVDLIGLAVTREGSSIEIADHGVHSRLLAREFDTLMLEAANQAKSKRTKSNTKPK